MKLHLSQRGNIHSASQMLATQACEFEKTSGNVYK